MPPGRLRFLQGRPFPHRTGELLRRQALTPVRRLRRQPLSEHIHHLGHDLLAVPAVALRGAPRDRLNTGRVGRRGRVNAERERGRPREAVPPAHVGREVVEGDEVFDLKSGAQLRDQAPGVLGAALECRQPVAVREDRRQQLAVDRVELRERLRDEREGGTVLAELGEHPRVVDGAQCARLVDELDDAAALLGQ